MLPESTYMDQQPSHKALLKIDFSNAFNNIIRDKILEATTAYIPDLLPFVHSALLWGGHQLLSSEGIQQGDPLGPMLFCLTTHELVSSLRSEFKAFYLDDGTMGGDIEALTLDLTKIREQGQALGLSLNMSESELISHDQSAVEVMTSSFPGLSATDPQDAILLGSPLGSNSMIASLDNQINQLRVVGERLCHLQVHDAITILRHSLAIPKLLHLLRTSPAFSSPLLESWDALLFSIASRITNTVLRPGDPSQLQASLPVGSGGLGLRSAVHLAPSAFLASADGAFTLVQQLLPTCTAPSTYSARDAALSTWRLGLPDDTPFPSTAHATYRSHGINQELITYSILSCPTAATKSIKPAS